MQTVQKLVCIGLFLSVVGVAPVAAEIMLPVIHADCDGELPNNGFGDVNVSAVCGFQPPKTGSVQENANVPGGFLHVPHYYHEDMIDQNTLEQESEQKSGPCYSPTVTVEDGWYRLSTERSGNRFCVYGEPHRSAYLFSNPIRFIQMTLGGSDTAAEHVH